MRELMETPLFCECKGKDNYSKNKIFEEENIWKDVFLSFIRSSHSLLLLLHLYGKIAALYLEA